MTISSLFGLTGIEGFEEVDAAWPMIKENFLDIALSDQLTDDTGQLLNREELSACLDEILEKVASGYTLAQLKGLTSEHLEAIYTLAHHVLQSGSIDEATCIFRFLTMLDSRSAKYLTAYGACMQMQFKYEEALKIYSIAQLLDTTDPRIPQNAGLCCLHLNLLDHSKGLFERSNSMCESFIEQLPAIGIQASQDKVEFKRLLEKGQQLLNIVKARLQQEAEPAKASSDA